VGQDFLSQPSVHNGFAYYNGFSTNNSQWKGYVNPTPVRIADIVNDPTFSPRVRTLPPLPHNNNNTTSPATTTPVSSNNHPSFGFDHPRSAFVPVRYYA